MTSLWKETVKEIEIRHHWGIYESTATKSTMTEYMNDTKQSDRTRLLKNAIKSTDTLTKEAYEERIVELQLEVAKRQEMVEALEEKICGLKKCISVGCFVKCHF